MLKILIVSQHFFPDNFRINEIAEELVKESHQVTVITSLPDYATGKVPKDCRGLKNRKFMYNGVSVIRCFSVSRRSGVLFRALNYVTFCLSSTLKALFLKEKFDIVMCYQTSPVLMANAARAAAKKQKIPFLLYCLDLWPESIKAWHVGESNPLFKIMHRYSKGIYNSADKVAVTSRPFIDYLCDVNNVDRDKTVYLPQHSENMNLSIKTLKESSKDSDIVFAFGGNIGSVQNVDCIIKAVNEIKDIQNFRVEIYGDGSEYENCLKLAQDLNVGEKIKFFGRVDKASLWKAYDNVDAFILTLKSEGVIGQTVPAKLQEYMSGERPVFASIDGAAAEIINESGCGVCVRSGDYRGLSEKMADFIQNPQNYSNCGKNGKDYFENHFTIEQFIKSLGLIIDEALKGRAK